jgi:hypothetical protein
VKVKLHKIIDSVEQLKNLSSKELPATASFSLSRLFTQLEEELAVFETTRIKLLNTYAKKGDDGNYSFSDVEAENRDKFNKEFGELLDLEINMSYDPLPISHLGDVKLSISDMVILKDFFTN